MSEDPFTTTAALRRISPFWSAVRYNAKRAAPAVALAMLGGLATIAVTAFKVMAELDQLQHQVAQLTDAFKESTARDKELAALQQRVGGIDEEVHHQRDRWDRIDEALDREPQRRRPRR